jgi:hypothetical protein
MRSRASYCLLTALGLLATAPTGGQDKKGDKTVPRVVVVLPLAAPPGATTQLTLRGLKLDEVTEVKFADDRVTVKVVSKGKANVPDKNPDKVGDTQLVVEVTLPAGLPDEPLPFVVLTAKEKSPPHKLLIEGSVAVIAEKEPNDGFKQATAINVPQVITGSIDRATDVDVFRFEGKKGQKIAAEVVAARYGSALDAMLTLYDADGEQLASNNGGAEGVDALLEVVLSRDGVYYLSLIDVHDAGGPTHVYRLLVR